LSQKRAHKRQHHRGLNEALGPQGSSAFSCVWHP
jgi:hypothetical protein